MQENEHIKILWSVCTACNPVPSINNIDNNKRTGNWCGGTQFPFIHPIDHSFIYPTNKSYLFMYRAVVKAKVQSLFSSLVGSLSRSCSMSSSSRMLESPTRVGRGLYVASCSSVSISPSTDELSLAPI